MRQGVGHNDHNDHPELRPPLRRGELYPATVIKSRAVARKSAEKCKKKDAENKGTFRSGIVLVDTSPEIPL